jgi:hypothetical protein
LHPAGIEEFHMPSDAPLQEAAPPEFYPTQFHPEFGYLAPRVPFRMKAWLVLKGTVFGALIGALAVIALVPNRDPPPVVPSAQAMSVAPADRWHMAPATVPFVPPTLAMPVANALPQRSGATASLKGPPANAQPPAEAAPAPKPPQKKAARKPPKRERSVPPAEPDPRSAYGAVRRFAEPQREWQDRRGFWNW